MDLSFKEIFIGNGGLIFAVLGAAFAAIGGGLGSARSTGMVGKAAAGIVTEEPEKFGKALILQLLPGTQGLYGFIIALLISTIHLSPELTLFQGFYLFFASVPVGFIGYKSAVFQAEVAIAGMQILAKNPDHNTKGMIFAAIVETYAILGFVASIIMVMVVNFY